MPRPPPSSLRSALRHEADKQALVDWVFERVAPRYDLGNTLLSAGLHRRWKRRLVRYARVEPGQRVLDLACGTGDVTWMLAEHGAQVTGLDNNPAMLHLARERPPPSSGSVELVEGDVAALPFPDASFDRVTCAYAGRGFPDLPAALREAWRVLKPGGELWHLDFARPPRRTLDRAWRTWLGGTGVALGTVLHGDPRIYLYIPLSLKHYPGQRWLKEQMTAVGFQAELIETRLCLMAYNRGVRPA